MGNPMLMREQKDDQERHVHKQGLCNGRLDPGVNVKDGHGAFDPYSLKRGRPLCGASCQAGLLGLPDTVSLQSRALVTDSVFPGGVGTVSQADLYLLSLFSTTLHAATAQAAELRTNLGKSMPLSLQFLCFFFSFVNSLLDLSFPKFVTLNALTSGHCPFSGSSGVFLFYDLDRGFRRQDGLTFACGLPL